MPATAATVTSFSWKALRRAALALLIASGAAGCRFGGDADFSRKGIGADLYSGDIAQATENLETYFGFICKQANVPVVTGENDYPVCSYASFRKQEWTIVLQTGFNDIDRRCDGYLEWLENLRLRGSYVNAQLNDAGRLTNAILTALAPTAGVTIGIVGEAFGFARSSFNNYQNRAMLGFEGSTIKTIVSERRLAYRIQFAKVLFEFKPDVVNVLRSYLRICMPYTITMDANTYARLITQGLPLPASFSPQVERQTVVGEQALRTSASVATGNQVGTGIDRPNIGQNNPNVVAFFGTDSGRSQDSVIILQKKLCVKGDGQVGPATRAAILAWRRADIGQKPGDDQQAVSKDEATQIGSLPDCALDKFTNIYEAENVGTQGQIDFFVATFNKAAPGVVTMPTDAVMTSAPDAVFRNRVATLRKNLVTTGKLAERLPAGTEYFITFDFVQAMQRAAREHP